MDYSLFNKLMVPVIVRDSNFNVIFINNYASGVIHNHGQGSDGSGHENKCYYLVHKYDKPCYHYGLDCPVKNLLGDPSKTSSSAIHIHADGTYYKIEAFRDNENKELFYQIHSAIPVSEVKKLVEFTRENNSNLSVKGLFYENPYPMLLMDPSTLTILDVNKSATDFYGFTVEELVGNPITATFNPFVTKEIVMNNVNIALSKSRNIFWGYKHRLKNGELRDVQVSLSIVDISGEKLVLITVVDMTDTLKREIKTDTNFAYFDILTGIPNNLFFFSRIKSVSSRARRHGIPSVLMLIRLSGFKSVNSKFGYELGNDLIKEATWRIKKSMRLEDELFRLGGVEFAVLADSLGSKADIIAISDRMLKDISMPFEISGIETHIASNIGIAIDLTGTASCDDLYNIARKAMLEARSRGKNKTILREIYINVV